MIVAPSILSADFNRLGEQIKSIEAATTWLHFDVMDGHFVPNISFGYKVLGDIDNESDLFMDVHLMVTEPLYLYPDFKKHGADLITFHVEAVRDITENIQAIKDLGLKVGVSIKPNTKPECLEPYLNDLDLVLIMSVYPGFGGQSFIDSTLETLDYLVQKKKEGYDFLIEMDGGIGPTNAPDLFKRGADVLVAGSAVFGSDNPAETIRKMTTLE